MYSTNKPQNAGIVLDLNLRVSPVRGVGTMGARGAQTPSTF